MEAIIISFFCSFGFFLFVFFWSDICFKLGAIRIKANAPPNASTHYHFARNETKVTIYILFDIRWLKRNERLPKHKLSYIHFEWLRVWFIRRSTSLGESARVSLVYLYRSCTWCIQKTRWRTAIENFRAIKLTNMSIQVMG